MGWNIIAIQQIMILELLCFRNDSGYREDSCGGGLVTANYSTGLIQVLIVILFYVWKLISWYGSYCK